MKRTLLAMTAAVAIAGCGGKSALPEATGEGIVRMINAIPTSPTVSFLIEERLLDSVTYKNSSAPQRWDDLTYTFNFQVSRPGQVQPSRIASQFVDVVRDVEYTLVIRGSVDAPTVDVWEIPARTFSGTESVFELRVGHAAGSLGTVDVYIGPEGVAPVPGEQAATLAPGEVSAATDVGQDTYVVTITPTGDPASVLYQSEPVEIASSQSVLITVFDGDTGDTAPVAARAFNEQGFLSFLPDSRFPPTARFVHATSDLGALDIYDDAALQNRIVADLAYGDITGHVDVPAGEAPITATTAGNVGAIQFEGTLTTLAGTRVNYYLTELAGEIVGTPVRFDNRPLETAARLTFFPASRNHRTVDVYIVDAGTPIDDVLPRQAGELYMQQTAPLTLSAGSYDLFITTNGEKTVLEGPIRLDAALGDVFEAVLLDRVDPSLAELRFFTPL